jgi:hypothetical protein
MEQELKDTIGRSPFSAVTRPEITAAGLNAAAAHPLYSRAHSVAWRILRTGVSDVPTDERLWVSPTWEIYERWCFVKLGTILRGIRPELKWERSEEHESSAMVAWVGRGDGVVLQLLLQPTFAAWDQSRARDWRSLSAEFIPDIVMTHQAETSRFIVFDGKYRAGRSNVLDAMRSAHMYHDAVRFRGRPPEYSLLFLPSSGAAPWLEKKEFHEQYRVGTLTLNESFDVSPLRSLILGFLRQT